MHRLPSEPLHTLPTVEMSEAEHKTQPANQGQLERSIRLAEATERSIRRTPDRGRAMEDGAVTLTVTIRRGETMRDALRRVLDEPVRRAEPGPPGELPDNVHRLREHDHG
jgi:hypothetical protein